MEAQRSTHVITTDQQINHILIAGPGGAAVSYQSVDDRNVQTFLMRALYFLMVLVCLTRQTINV